LPKFNRPQTGNRRATTIMLAPYPGPPT
jgi:hypothetical protein